MNKNKSKQEETTTEIQRHLLNELLVLASLVLLLVAGIMLFYAFGDSFFQNSKSQTQLNPKGRIIDPDRPPPVEVEGGIDLVSGLHYGKGFQTVRAVCTACHSSKLITQNRATYEGWQEMILWMQETQGLQDLGPQEPIILEYLATFYAPEEMGRRPNLEVAEWYELKE